VIISAGAMSVAAHLVSPQVKGLFHRAIMQSNPFVSSFNTRASATVKADAMMTYCKCPVDDVQCMRNITVKQILIAQSKAIPFDLRNFITEGIPWSPLVEPLGSVPVSPLIALENGLLQGSIPVLAGTMRDEGRSFVYNLFQTPVDATTFAGILSTTIGAQNYPAISQYYPIDTNCIDGKNDSRSVLATMITDLMFFCPLKAIGLQNRFPSYLYRFTHVSSFNALAGQNYCYNYSCHGYELTYVFNVFGTDTINLNETADDRLLADYMSSIWSNFVTNGDPNVGLTIPSLFPVYNSYLDSMLLLDQPVPSPPTDNHYRSIYCWMWSSFLTTGKLAIYTNHAMTPLLAPIFSHRIIHISRYSTESF